MLINVCKSFCFWSFLVFIFVCNSVFAEGVFSSGQGTPEDPYLVSTLEQLVAVRSEPEAYFCQTADISIEQSNDGLPIGTPDIPFTGVFDGNGYAVVNAGDESLILDFESVFGVSADDSLRAIRFENSKPSLVSASSVLSASTEFADPQALPLDSLATAQSIFNAPPVPVIPEAHIAIGIKTTGEMSDANRQDLYSIQVNQNGILELTLAGNIRTSGYLRLYDVDGKTQITNVNVVGRDPVTIRAGLYPGTYFVVVDRSQETWAYEIDAALTPYPEDPEPDNIADDAAELEIGTTIEGFIGFYAHGFTDTNDWRKVTTEENGRLTVTLSSPDNAQGQLRLYDVDRATHLVNDNLDANVLKNTATVVYDLSPGTYYIRVERTNNLWAYSLSTEFQSALLANDFASNEHFTESTALAVGGSATGHLGYYRHGFRDDNDWWKVTATQDGILTVNLNVTDQHPGAQARVHVWSPDWTENKSVLVNVDALENTASVTLGNAYRPGVYWIRVERVAGSAWSYTLSNSFARQAVAVQPFDAARVLPLGGSGNGSIDGDNTVEWWKVTTTGNGELTVNATFSESPGAYVRLYDVNGTRELRGIWVDGTVTGNLSYPVASGTYYVSVSRWSNRNYSYTLANSFAPASFAVDPEPNNVFSSAVRMPLDGFVTGQLGYYKNSLKDDADWWQIDITQNGELTIQAEFTESPGAYVRLYDVNGTRELRGIWVDGTVVGNLSYPVAPGTYYVSISRWSNRDYSYTLENSFAPASFAVDPEPNNVFSSSVTMSLNGTVTGQLGYYGDAVKDDADWWKINVVQNGQLTIDVEFTKSPGAYLRLYDVNGNRELKGIWIDGKVVDGFSYQLAPGAYYVSVSRWSDRDYSYALSASFEPASLPADKEFNDDPRTALPIEIGNQYTGHLYYQSNNWFDDADWYRVTTSLAGSLVANLASNINPGAYIRIYDADLNQKASTYINSFEPRSAVAQNLAAGTYYIKVERWSANVFSYILTTSLATENQAAPQVVSTFPSDGSLVSIQDFATATFSALMNPATISADTFSLRDSNGNSVAGVVGYTGTIASYYPDRPLTVGETYTAVITTGAQDIAGTPLAANYSWRFTVGSSEVDIIEPTQFTLTVNRSGTGTGQVVSHPAGIDCGSTCSAAFDEGLSVLLTAVAAEGSTFAGWSGACTGSDGCTVSMMQNRTVGALFERSSTTCPYDDTLTLSGQTISSSRSFGACRTLTAGPAFVIAAGGDVVFEAGRQIVLQVGFQVQAGGRFTARINTGLSTPATTQTWLQQPMTADAQGDSVGSDEEGEQLWSPGAAEALTWSALPEPLRDELNRRNALIAEPQATVGGEWIVFATDAALVGSDDNDHSDIYAYHSPDRTLHLISLNAAGLAADAPSLHPRLSEEGIVIYQSGARDLSLPAGNGFAQLYRYDLRQGTIQRLTEGFDGLPGNGDTGPAQIASDWILYRTEADSLEPEGTGLYRQHLVLGLRELVGLDVWGQPARNARQPSAAGDGQTIAYQDRDEAGSSAIMLNDHGQIVRLSEAFDNELGKAVEVDLPALSADGRYLAYREQEADGSDWLRVRDRLNGQQARLPWPQGVPEELAVQFDAQGAELWWINPQQGLGQPEFLQQIQNPLIR